MGRGQRVRDQYNQMVDPQGQCFLTQHFRHLRLDLGYDREGLRSARGIRLLAIKRRSELAEALCAQLASIWELVASLPAPRGDHPKHEDPALAQQILIDTGIVLADVFGR